MGFRKRLRKRFAKLTRLSKRKSTTASARSNSAALMTIKEEISELNQQTDRMLEQGSQKLDIAERELKLLVTELKDKLLSATRCDLSQRRFGTYKFNSLADYLNDYSEPKETSDHREFAEVAHYHVIQDSDEQATRTAVFSGETKCQVEIGGESPSSQADLSRDGSYLQLLKEIDQMITQGGEEEGKSGREINENEGQLSNLNTVCLDVSIIKETPEETMRRARLAFESVPIENNSNPEVLGQQSALTSTDCSQSSGIEPPWSVPDPKPPSLFPHIDRCWLDEEINHNDPIEVYMHQNAISWTAPQCGGPTTAMIQAGRMDLNPPPHFYIEELN